MITCTYCGKEYDNIRNLRVHACTKKKKALSETYEKFENMIVDKYKEGYSPQAIQEMLCSEPEALDAEGKCILLSSYIRSKLSNSGSVKMRGCAESRNEKVLLRSRQTCLNRYGVDNISKTEKERKRTSDFNRRNSKTIKNHLNIVCFVLGTHVPKSKENEFKRYRDSVNNLTKRVKQDVVYDGTCYYTGIPLTENRFNDLDYKTIDHKTSIISGFLMGITAEEIACVDNLCWCSRLANNAKREMNEREFLESDRFKRLMYYESNKEEFSR